MADRPVKPYSEKSLRELAQELSAIRVEYEHGQPFDNVSLKTLNAVEAELVRRHDLEFPPVEQEAVLADPDTPLPTGTIIETKDRPFGVQHDLPDAEFFRADRGPGAGYANAPEDFGNSAKE